MTQYGYVPLSPEDSGSTLLERVNGVVPALLTNHKGAARPAYVQPGMMWIDDSGALWLLNLFDGSSDVPIAEINPVTHVPVTAFVPLARKLSVGLGLSVDDVAGSDEAPATFDLSADRLIKLALAPTATVVAGVDEKLPVHSAGVHAAIAAFLATANLGSAEPKAWKSFSASGNYTPTPGTKFVLISCQGGGGGGGGYYSSTSGGSGASGGTSHSFATVEDGATYPVVVGAGGYNATGNNNGGAGGGSTVTIDGTVYGAGGGGGGLVKGTSPASPGGPYATAFLGFYGAGGNTSGSNGSNAGAGQPNYIHGGYWGQGGTGQGPNYGSTYGSAGHVEILEFGA
jgi:hypothetical protein